MKLTLVTQFELMPSLNMGEKPDRPPPKLVERPDPPVSEAVWLCDPCQSVLDASERPDSASLPGHLSVVLCLCSSLVACVVL